jgi:hypothetical protein
MTALSLLSGRFAYSAASSVRAAGVVAPKMFGAALSPIASATRNIKDEYVPSAPVSVRNTYSPLTKRVQNTVTVQNTTPQVPAAQVSSSDARNAYLLASKVQQNQSANASSAQSSAVAAPQWLQEMMNSDMPEGLPFSSNRTGGVRGGISLRAESSVVNSVVDETSNSLAGAFELFMKYDDKTGAMTAYDRNGNVLDVEYKQSTIWNDVAKDPNRRQEFLDMLEENPGLAWRFDLGDGESINKAYEGHDILNTIFPKVYQSVTALVQGNTDRVLDEYGYTYSVPAWSSGGDFVAWSNSVYQDGRQQNMISSSQLRGFDYLTLEEHDVLYAEIQKIFDQFGVQLDARQEHYAFLQPTPEGYVPVGCNGMPVPADWTPYPGGWQWVDIGSGIDKSIVQKVEDAMLTNTTIRSLYEKAEGVRNGSIADDTLAQNYSILVTDKDGNRLAQDRIIVAAKNGNQVEMSVDQFSQMSRLDITKLLR